MEEQSSAGGAERQVAELVEDDKIGVGEPGGDLSWFALKLLLFESVDGVQRWRRTGRACRWCSIAWMPIAAARCVLRAVPRWRGSDMACRDSGERRDIDLLRLSSRWRAWIAVASTGRRVVFGGDVYLDDPSRWTAR